MIQLWSAIGVALLTVVIGPLLRGEVSGRLLKRISEHANLREKLAENSAALKDLDALLDLEVRRLRERERHRLTRKLNGANVAALIFVALAGGGIVYGLLSLGISLGPTGWAIAAYVGAALVAVFAVGLAAVGVGTLYEPPKEKK
ncbi:hypothetical protein [Microbacterium sp. SORGH_AS_0862]|uniref:hypothetical protein n=1 Tax=Microbacterium sp. SORGH_AS_0862 TaxID=3041789 RepID=UPI00278CEBCA|nr:hypothetical protein [Microbacterium sp. SORGH_AS_0862]MDQ1206602.1 putative membrane protein YdbT with pleckstrin-like domain [Microbacterium sp. SORGH_AS_0862]